MVDAQDNMRLMMQKVVLYNALEVQTSRKHITLMPSLHLPVKLALGIIELLSPSQEELLV